MTLIGCRRALGAPVSLVVGVALATFGFGVGAAAPAHAEVTECAPGWSTQYVAVVVGSSVTCVTPGGSGLDVLDRAAGGLRFDDSGLLCAIGGEPASGCGQATGGGSYEYWAYFTCRSGSGGFQYSSVGPGSRSPAAGDVEGWNFIIGSGTNETPPSPSLDVCGADVTTTASTSEPTTVETSTTTHSAAGSTTAGEATTSASAASADTTRVAAGATSGQSSVEPTGSRPAPGGPAAASTTGQKQAAVPNGPAGPAQANESNAPTSPLAGAAGASAPSVDLAAISIALGAAPNSSGASPVVSLDLAAIGQLARSSSASAASSAASASASRAARGNGGASGQTKGGDTALSVQREPADDSLNWQALVSAGAVAGLAGAALVTRRRRAARMRPVVEGLLGD